MMTVNEVSKLAGVSIRTLQYYDKIGLLHPTGYTDAGYRLYDDADLERLQHILLFRELEFPLKDIKMIVNSPDFDRSKALEQQIELLRLKKEHIENLMNFALSTLILRKQEKRDTILRTISALTQWNLKRTISRWETVMEADLFQNLQVVWTVQTGLSQMENGKTALMNQRQEILSSLIGKATVQQTTLVS